MQRLRLAVVTCCFVSACGSPADPVCADVMFLELRTAEGLSPVAVLAAEEHTWASWGASDAHKDWRTKGGADDEQSRLTPFGRPLAKGSGARQQLVYTNPIETAKVNCIELALRLGGSAHARLSWWNEKASTWGHTSVRLPGGDELQVARFFPATEPSWSGTVSNLTIEPDWIVPHAYEIERVSFLNVGFQPGSCVDESTADGGLVQIGDSARRSWPATEDGPLFSHCRIPGEASLHVWVSVSSRSHRTRGYRCEVAVRESGDSWAVVGSKAVASDATAANWTKIRADLSSYANEEVALRFRVVAADDLDDNANQRALVLWASPIVAPASRGSSRPSIILVTLDTARADYVGDERVSPYIASLGASSTVFESTWSNTNMTLPAHASLFTGTYLRDHGAVSNRSVLESSHETLTEILRENGYWTVAAVSVDHVQANTGLGQGFCEFLLPEARAYGDGAITVSKALDALAWLADEDIPFFLWVHLYDPHSPYGPPESFMHEFESMKGEAVPPREVAPPTIPSTVDRSQPDYAWLEGISNDDHVEYLYAAGVSYADSLVKVLLESLDGVHNLEDCFVIITADHGEGLGDNGVWYRHTGLTPGIVRIPLIIGRPGVGEGSQVLSPVSLVDIAPTVLSQLGMGVPTQMLGVDMFTHSRDRDASQEPIWFEGARLQRVGLRTDRHHFSVRAKYLDQDAASLIKSGDYELREVLGSGDAGEGKPIRDSRLAIEYVDRLRKWRAKPERRKVERPMSAAEEEMLRALGY